MGNREARALIIIGGVLIVGVSIIAYALLTSSEPSEAEEVQARPTGDPDLELINKQVTADYLSFTVQAYSRVPEGTIKLVYYYTHKRESACNAEEKNLPTLTHEQTKRIRFKKDPEFCQSVLTDTSLNLRTEVRLDP